MTLVTLTAPRTAWREPSALPGFGLAMGYTLVALSIIVLLPLAALALRPWELGFSGFIEAVTSPRVLAALRLSFGAALIAACVNAVSGSSRPGRWCGTNSR